MAHKKVLKKIEDLISLNLVKMRNKARLTQEELAAKADISLRMLQKLEYKQSWIGARTLERLAKALSVRPSQLFEDTYAMAPTLEALLETLNKLQTVLVKQVTENRVPDKFALAYGRLNEADQENILETMNDLADSREEKKQQKKRKHPVSESS